MIVRADADLGRRGHRCGPGLLRQRRPDLHRDRADLRPRAAARRVPRGLRRGDPRGHPRCGLRPTRSRSARSPPPSSWRSPRTHVADALDHGAVLVAGGKARPDLGPLLLRAHRPHRRRADHEGVRRGDVRAGGRGLPRRRRRGRAHPRQRHRVRPLGQHLVGRPRRRPPARWLGSAPVAVNINDGYLSAIGSVAAPMGGMKASGRRSSARRRRDPALHRVADGGGPDARHCRTPPSPRAFLAAVRGAAMRTQIAAARLRNRRRRRSS